MRRKLNKPLCWLLLLALPTLAAASLNIEVTRGLKGMMPIGVMPFIWESQTKQPPVKLASIVAADLNNSGKFKPTLTDAPPKNPGDIDLSQWQSQKVNAVLTGEVSDQGAGQYRVHYVLTNVFKNPENIQSNSQAVFGVDSGAPLLEGSMLVTQAALRHSAHQIANQIYAKLMGRPGIFMTKLTFVAIKRVGGDRIQYQLYLSDYDGHGARVIYTSPEPIITPTWSPDSRSIAFVAYRGGQSGIYLYTLADKNLRLISQFSGVNSAPVFSPDGHKLYLALSMKGGVNLFQIDLTTHQLQQVTDDLSVNTGAAPDNTGQRLFFTSTRAGSPQVYALNLVSKQVLRVSFGGLANMAPTAEANALIYLQQTSNGYQNILVLGDKTQLIGMRGQVYPGVLSPDALMFVYGVMQGNQRRFSLLTLATGRQQILPRITADMRYPAWSQ